MGTKIRHNEARFLPRLKCNFDTAISIACGEIWSCKIIDMSQRGIGIITDLKLKKGDKVHITDPDADAEVVWSRHNRAGLAWNDWGCQEWERKCL